MEQIGIYPGIHGVVSSSTLECGQSFSANADGQHRAFRLFAVIIAAVLFLKFAAYALWVTPLWDTPDEPGHYSFAVDLARGHYPVLGESRIDQQVMDSSSAPGAQPTSNYIAQHPPLYYALAAPVVAIAKAADLDFEQQVRATRLTSALFGALAVLGITLLIYEATRSPLLGLASGIIVSATPTFLQLSTGVNHDTLVACTSAWGIYWCVRWLYSNSLQHALYSALFIGLGLLTKYTALAMAVPLFGSMAYRLWMVRRSDGIIAYLKRAALLWLVMFLPIVIWMLRNVFVHGQLTTGSTSNEALVSIGFFEYMQSAPVWQDTLRHYIGLIGYGGRPGGVSFVQATGPVLQYFLGLIMFLSAAALALPFMGTIRTRHPYLIHSVLILIAVSAAITVINVDKKLLLGMTCLGLFAAVASNLIASLRGFLTAQPLAWTIATSAICVALFSLAFYHHLWSTYIGVLRAAQGRYFYPVLPFLAIILLAPMRTKPWPSVVLVASLAAMILCDHYFLHYAFKLYQQL